MEVKKEGRITQENKGKNEFETRTFADDVSTVCFPIIVAEMDYTRDEDDWLNDGSARVSDLNRVQLHWLK